MAVKLQYTRSTWTERFAIGGLLVFSLLLVQLTIWKESQLFWMDVGGYPIWLRQTVQTLYYPFLFLVLAYAAMLCRSVVGRFFRSFQVCKTWLLLGAALVILSGCLGLLVANNLINLVNDRPLHYHPPIESSAVDEDF
jgi:hypothetical protein